MKNRIFATMIVAVTAMSLLTACAPTKPIEGFISEKLIVPEQVIVQDVCSGIPETCESKTSTIPASWSFKVINMNTETNKPQERETPVSEADYNKFVIGDFYSTDPDKSRVTSK